MITKTEPTYVIRLYLSGPIEVAKQVLREHCLPGGLCVTIESTLFIFAGGEEAGFVVGLLNYPRFPVDNERLRAQAHEVMLLLLKATAQHSALMVTPEASTWVSNRPQA